MAIETTKDQVEQLLGNFADYVNPEGDHDPWFTLAEINQQFAWDDIDDVTLEGWLGEMVEAGHVIFDVQEDGKVWAWRS